MKAIMSLVVTVMICLCLAFLPNFAQGMDALESAYKDQYIESNKEINDLQAIIKIYSDCIKKTDELRDRMTFLHGEHLAGRLSRRDSIAPRKAILEENLAVLVEALQAFNYIKGENRSDISIDEIKRDLELNRRRIKELTDKKRDLKIKVLEKKGTLLGWWTD